MEDPVQKVIREEVARLTGAMPEIELTATQIEAQQKAFSAAIEPGLTKIFHDMYKEVPSVVDKLKKL